MRFLKKTSFTCLAVSVLLLCVVQLATSVRATSAGDLTAYASKNRSGVRSTTHSNHPACGVTCDHETTHEALSATRWYGGTMYSADYYLGSNLTLNTHITVKNNARLCLNGHTLTFGEGYTLTVAEGASLVLCDCKGAGSIVRGARVSNSDSSIISNQGTLTIYGGSYCLDGEGVAVSNSGTLSIYDGSFGINISNYGTATIYGGSYSGPLAYYAALQNGANATMTIYDCTVETEGTALSNNGTATIYGGTFHMTGGDSYNYYSCINNRGRMDIYDVNISVERGNGIYNEYDYNNTRNGTLYFRNGTVTADAERGAAIYNNRSLYVYGGTLQGANGIVNTSNVAGSTATVSTCTITGGTISGSICGVRNSGSTWTSYTNGVGTKSYNKATLTISNRPSISKLILEYAGALTFNYNGDEPIDLEIDLEDFAVGEKVWDYNSSKISLVNLVMEGYMLKYSTSVYGVVLLTDQCGAEGADLHWKLSNDGVLTIFGTGEMKYEYSGTRYPWGDRCNEIKTVIVEPGATKIPQYAFEYCENLTTVSLPETLTYLSLQAFQDCGSLNNLRLPASLTTLSGYTSGSKISLLRCESMTDLYYVGTAEQWEALLGGKTLTSNDSEMTIHFLQLYETVPTCTTSGVQAHYRFEDTSVYDDVYDTNGNPIEKAAVLPALGHDYVDHAARIPTCTEIGWDAYKTCARCDYSTYTELAALGHQMIQLPAVAPTCTQAGLTEGSCCLRCQEVETAQREIPAAGHSYTADVCTACGNRRYTVGDLDGAAGINEDDAIYLLNHILMPELFPVEQPVDFDRNGEINEEDAIYLLIHVLMPEAFPL